MLTLVELFNAKVNLGKSDSTLIKDYRKNKDYTIKKIDRKNKGNRRKKK